jgi:head-tail adaptor
MRAGMLTETIEVVKPVIVETEYSGKKTDYATCCRTRAEVLHRGGGKAIENAEIVTSYTVMFSIRMYHRITPDMIIIHNESRYRILDINPQKAQQRIIITGEVINE